MSDPVPPAEARRARDDFLGTFTAEALEELVYYEASTGPGQAALSVELPPLRLEERHGCALLSALRALWQGCENSTDSRKLALASLLASSRARKFALAACKTLAIDTCGF